VPNWAEPAWHLYVIRHSRRDVIQQALTKAGIGTLIHYPIPPHRQEAYEVNGQAIGDYPLADRLAAEVLSLPIGPHLNPDDASKVVETIKDFED
jgi:dTDP-4-amino-4,6-dideoxygalactose transaminase